MRKAGATALRQTNGTALQRTISEVCFPLPIERRLFELTAIQPPQQPASNRRSTFAAQCFGCMQVRYVCEQNMPFDQFVYVAL